MADRIVTAEKADRTPNWEKWRLIPEPRLWQCVALSLNIDPDTVELSLKFGWDPILQRRLLEFRDKIDIACENLQWTLPCTAVEKDRPELSRVNLRDFAAWVRQMEWDAPQELLAMADKQVAIKSGKRTDPATATRAARKTDRLGALKRFIEDVCKALDKDGYEIRESDGRKRLPVSAGDLHTLFLVRHPEHEVSQPTFNDDLGKIVTLKPGPKRYEIKELAEMLAGKFSW